MPAIFIWVVTAALFFCFQPLAVAATLTSFTSKEGKVVVVLSGQIEAGDAERVTALIRQANEATKFVSGIRLNSPGGDLAEGVRIADVVRKAKMASVVPSGSTCASACFVVFAAGEEKYVSNSALVGVHGASENGSETSSSSAATIAMARIVKELGVPATVVGKMVVTPPSQVVWLTANDLRAMGTTMTGKPAQLAAVAPVPQQLPSDASAAPIQANAPPTWKTVTDGAMALSSAQNGGQPILSRQCQPEFAICTIGLFFKSKEGTSMMVRTTEDVSGKLTQREICSFNAFGDVRKCFDWDAHITRTDMKDSRGQWSQVARN